MFRLIKVAGSLAAAAASCYLGLLASLMLRDGPRLVVAALSDSEVFRVTVRGLLPRFFILPPSQASLPVFLLYSAGPILLAVLALIVGPRILPRLKGWGRLAAGFTLFWLALLIVESAVAFVGWGRGSLTTFLRVLGPSDFGAPVFPALLGLMLGVLALSLVCRAVRSLQTGFHASAPKRFGSLVLWFAAPVALLSLLSQASSFGWWPRRMGMEFLPALLALIVVAVVAWKPGAPGRPFQPRVRGALATLLAGGLALTAIWRFPDLPRRTMRAEFDTRQSRHWQLSFEKGALMPWQQIEWGEAADRRIEALAARLKLPIDGKTWRAQVHVSSGNKQASEGERSNDDGPFSLDLDQRAVYHLLAPGGKIADPRGEALLLLSTQWGDAGSRTLGEAVSRYAVGNFHGQDLTGYAQRIACEERPYTLREILSLDPSYLSPLVRDAMRGAWVEWLVREHGDKVLSILYRTPLVAGGEESVARAIGTSWQSLEETWRRNLTQDVKCQGATGEIAARAEPKRLGISFSHEYGAGWGYGSDVAQQQLAKIRNLGANSIAVMPYAFTQAPESTQIRFRTDETDDRVVRTIQKAKDLGLGVMLKPHLWARGRFTGNIVFHDEGEFRLWFAQYRRWLLHFARLAEIHGVEMLVLGNELGGVASHESEWRDLIHDVRRVYHGPLTYAAHWDGEFEALAFWDELDYLGVNFYFPLAPKGEQPRADSPRMKELIEKIGSVSRKFGKPVLFTEVGFPSVTTAAAEPWRETNAAFDLELQRQCYEAVFQAFMQRPWFAGLYWWKWPTHGRGGPYDPSHNPIGKPALKVVEHWYQRPPSDLQELSE